MMQTTPLPRTVPERSDPLVEPPLYEFERTPDRRDTDSRKWNTYHRDVLPMWIADMDFESPPQVTAAIAERAAQGIFDYGRMEPPLSEVICQRLRDRYAWQVEPEELIFVPGLGPALHMACREFTGEDAEVLVQTPIYPPFLSAPVHENRRLVCSELTGIRNGSRLTYEIDFDRFASLVGPKTELFMLCNPHNPIGRSFDVSELTRLAEHCLRENVIICSDEVHCDLLLDGQQHRPLATLDPEIARNCITLMAPSKTFNLAGLSFSFAVVQNPRLRRRFAAAVQGRLPRPNVLACRGALAAYRDCDGWLGQLLDYLATNRNRLMEALDTALPGIAATRPDTTYLAWLDCRNAGIAGNPQKFFLEQAGVAFNDGADFGPGGEGFVRLNFACPSDRLARGLDRMRTALERM